MEFPPRRVRDFPRPPAMERSPLPVRIVLGGVTIAETGAAWRILETMHPPTYYLPAEAFLPGSLTQRPRRSFCEWKGHAVYFTVSAGGRSAVDAAWGYPDPSPGYAAIRNHIAVYAGAMDACFVGTEMARPQPGGFYGGWITDAFLGPFKGAPGTEFW